MVSSRANEPTNVSREWHKQATKKKRQQWRERPHVCVVSIGTSRKIIDDEVITNNKNDSIPAPLAESAPASSTSDQPASQSSKAVKQLPNDSHTGEVIEGQTGKKKNNTKYCIMQATKAKQNRNRHNKSYNNNSKNM